MSTVMHQIKLDFLVYFHKTKTLLKIGFILFDYCQTSIRFNFFVV